MSFSLHLQGAEEEPKRQALSRAAAFFQFMIAFAGAFVIFDAAVTGGHILDVIIVETMVTAKGAKLSLAAALLR
jgi:hypothetical protein